MNWKYEIIWVQKYFKIITHFGNLRFKDKFLFYNTDKDLMKLEIKLQMH